MTNTPAIFHSMRGRRQPIRGHNRRTLDALRHGPFILRRAYITLATSLVAGSVLLFDGLLLEVRIDLPDLVFAVLALAGSGADVAGILALFSASKRLRRTFDATGGYACLRCAHDLSGAFSAGRCPECGRPYRRVGLRRRWRHAARLIGSGARAGDQLVLRPTASAPR